MRNYVLLNQKQDSIEFDKDHILGLIDDFDEFDREGCTISSICEKEIAKMFGVSNDDVFVSRIDCNYRDSSKYLADFTVRYYLNLDEIKNNIKKYVESCNAVLVGETLTFRNGIVFVNLAILTHKRTTLENIAGVSGFKIQEMLQDMYPNLNFSVGAEVAFNNWIKNRKGA